MSVMHLHSTLVDIDEAEDRLRRSYPTLRIHRRRGGDTFIMEERLDGDLDFHAIEVVFSAASSAALDDTGGFLVLRTSDSPIQLSNGRRIETTDRPVLVVPGGPLSSTWEQNDVQALLVPADTVRTHVERRVRSDEMLTPDHLIRVSSQPLADQWNRFEDYLVRDFFRADGAFDNELLRATTEELCVRMLLAVFFPPSAHRPVDGRGAMPASVRRAVTFIDDHPQEPITISDIADAARLSIRGLQAAMRRHLDTTPYEYLRIVRLNGARQALRSPAADTTVASVATAWGFGHLGRFAGAYRELFGETPRATLQWSRS